MAEPAPAPYNRADYDLSPCLECGSPLEVEQAPPPHHAMAVCLDCGFGQPEPAFRGWLKEPRKVDRTQQKRDANAAWRVMHQDLDGSVMCVICLFTSAQRPDLSFDVDHIVPLELDGPDTYPNTRILCSDCHTIRHVLERAARRIRGRAA